MTESDRMTDAAVRPLGQRTPSMDREEARWQAPTVDSDRLNHLALPAPEPLAFQPVMLSDDETPGRAEEPPKAQGPSGIDTVEGDWTLPDRSTLDPANAAHRVAFRLVGVAGAAKSVVAGLGSDAASTHVGARSRADVEAVSGAVAGALHWHNTNEVAGRRRMEDPHFEHRVRLTRELKRWPEPDRTVLALRFLAEWSVEQIADVTGSGEGAVRDVTRWWDASEGDNDGGLLHALDQWTEQPDDPGDGAFAPPGALAHLDDLYETAPTG